MPHPGPLIPRRPHTSSTITVTATQLREHLTCPPTRTSHPSRVLITAAGAGVAHARGHYGTAGTVGPIGVGACRPHDHELSVRHTRPAPYRHPPSHPSEIRTPIPCALIDGRPLAGTKSSCAPMASAHSAWGSSTAVRPAVAAGSAPPPPCPPRPASQPSMSSSTRRTILRRT